MQRQFLKSLSKPTSLTGGIQTNQQTPSRPSTKFDDPQVNVSNLIQQMKYSSSQMR